VPGEKCIFKNEFGLAGALNSETKGLDDIGIKRYSYSTENMKIGHRFHHYGTFGMVFILH